MAPANSQSGWEKLLLRLHRAAEGLEETLTQTDSQVRQRLDQRAKLMALAVDRLRSEELGQEVLSFYLSGQRCALPTRFVFELFPFPPITVFPGVEPHVVGVANVRGQILLVIDLARLFGFPKDQTNREEQLLIVGVERPEFCMICKGEGQVMRLPKSSLSRSKELYAAPLSGCVEAVTKDGLLLLDGKELLRDSRFYINQAG